MSHSIRRFADPEVRRLFRKGGSCALSSSKTVRPRRGIHSNWVNRLWEKASFYDAAEQQINAVRLSDKLQFVAIG